MSTDKPAPLLRALGPVEGITLVVGSVIGSGIFIKPALIATQVPYFGGIILVWVVSGVLSLAGALAYAELGAMIPRAGGQYVYLREAYGPFIGFLYGWVEFLVNRAGGIAALATATAIYMSDVVKMGDAMQSAVAIIAIIILTAINYCGVKLGGVVQNVFTYAKVFVVVAIIAGAAFLGQGSFQNYSPMWPETFEPRMLSLFGAAMVGALWAYDGWGNLNTVAEEIKNPQRNVPLCLFVGMAFLIVIYVSANLAYHAVLPLKAVMDCNAPDASTVASATALKLLGPAGITLIALGVMCSTFGAANGGVLTGARITYAMGRDRAFFQQLEYVHPRYRTPHIAILVQGIWSCALILLAGRIPTKTPVFEILTESVIVASWIFYALTVASVFVLRRKMPDAPRPYRCWGYPVVPLIFILMAIAFVGNALRESILSANWGPLLGLGLTALGVPAYVYFRSIQERPATGTRLPE